MSTDSMVFLAGIAVTLAACVLVVIYLRNHLERILLLLCGTPEPAKFWTVFTNVTLILTPIVFALSYQPDTHLGRSAVFELSNQLRLGLAGLVFSVLIMGIVINRSVPTYQKRKAQLEAPPAAQAIPPAQPSPAQVPAAA